MKSLMKKRLNFDVPRALVPQVLVLAGMAGQEPSYWIRKQIENAVREKIQELHNIN